MRRSIVTGEQIGALTAEEDVGKRNGHRLWRCRCNMCGGTCLRTAGALMQAQKRGVRSACDACRFVMHEAWRAAINRAEWRRLWEQQHTLWSGSAIEGLRDQIRSDVSEQLGGFRDDDELPSGSTPRHGRERDPDRWTMLAVLSEDPWTDWADVIEAERPQWRSAPMADLERAAQAARDAQAAIRKQFATPDQIEWALELSRTGYWNRHLP